MISYTCHSIFSVDLASEHKVFIKRWKHVRDI